MTACVGYRGSRAGVIHPLSETRTVPSVVQHSTQVTGEWSNSEYAAGAKTRPYGLAGESLHRRLFCRP